MNIFAKTLLLIPLAGFLIKTDLAGPTQQAALPHETPPSADHPATMSTIDDAKPTYEGGDAALHQFLLDNLQYPADAEQKGIEGRVVVTGVVSKEGKLIKLRTLGEPNDLLAAEALRVIKMLPNTWKPGYQNGHAVNAIMTIPLQFRL